MIPAEVAQRHADEFVFMVMDQAGWHVAGALSAPASMRLVFLPPHSLELDPAEHPRKPVREDCFAHKVFKDLDHVERTPPPGRCAHVVRAAERPSHRSRGGGRKLHPS